MSAAKMPDQDAIDMAFRKAQMAQLRKDWDTLGGMKTPAYYRLVKELNQ